MAEIGDVVGDYQEFRVCGHDDGMEKDHMAIEKELLDRLLAGCDPNEVFSKDGLVDDLKRALSKHILST